MVTWACAGVLGGHVTQPVPRMRSALIVHVVNQSTWSVSPRGQSVRTGTAASSLKPVLMASCLLSAVPPLACPFQVVGAHLVIQALVAQHKTTGLFKGTPRCCGIGAPLKVV